MEDYSEGIKNSKGKTRTFEENRMILLALKAALRRRLEGEEDKRKIIWSAIDREVASDFGYWLTNVNRGSCSRGGNN